MVKKSRHDLCAWQKLEQLCLLSVHARVWSSVSWGWRYRFEQSFCNQQTSWGDSGFFFVTLVDRACDVPSQATGCESGVCAVPTRLRGFALTQYCSAMSCWKGQRRPQAMDTVGTQSTDIYTFSNHHSLLYTSFPAYMHIQLVSQSSTSFSSLF